MSVSVGTSNIFAHCHEYWLYLRTYSSIRSLCWWEKIHLHGVHVWGFPSSAQHNPTTLHFHLHTAAVLYRAVCLLCNTRYCEDLSVSLSVCLSVCLCQTRALWQIRQNERNLCPHSYTTWKINHSLFDKKNGWWRRPFLPEILGQTHTVGA